MVCKDPSNLITHLLNPFSHVKQVQSNTFFFSSLTEVRCKGSSGGKKRVRNVLSWGVRAGWDVRVWFSGWFRSGALETQLFNECFSISALFDPRNVDFNRMSQLFCLFSLLRCSPSTCDTLLSSTGARVSTHFLFQPRFCVSDCLRLHFVS